MHYFHFILDKEIIDRLLELERQGGEALSSILRRIFAEFFTSLNRFFFVGRKRKREYTLINEDLEVPRKDVWVALDQDVFDRLQKIRYRLEFLSIAQVVRAVIAEYLNFLVCGGVAGGDWMRGNQSCLKMVLTQEAFAHHMINEKLFLIQYFRDFWVV